MTWFSPIIDTYLGSRCTYICGSSNQYKCAHWLFAILEHIAYRVKLYTYIDRSSEYFMDTYTKYGIVWLRYTIVVHKVWYTVHSCDQENTTQHKLLVGPHLSD